MRKISLILISCVFLLTGCWDKVELEDRGLVISIGVDKYEGNEKTDNDVLPIYTVSMIIPEDYELSDDEDNQEILKKENAEAVNTAMKKIDSFSRQSLYYGHTKVCILGEDILKDTDAFKEAIDGLERNREISRKIVLLATKDRAENVYKIKAEKNTMLGIFVNDFYKNNARTMDSSIKQDLEKTIQQLLATSNAVIPEIEIQDEKKVKLGGLAVIKNYNLAGWLDEKETRGFLWLTDYDLGGIITVAFENGYVPLEIDKKKSSMKISEENGKPIINISVEVEGTVDEYTLNKSILLDSNKYKILQNEFEDSIKADIQKTADILQNKMAVDVIGFKEKCRKFNYDLFELIDGDWNKNFSNAQIRIDASVKIKGSGSIK